MDLMSDVNSDPSPTSFLQRSWCSREPGAQAREVVTLQVRLTSAFPGYLPHQEKEELVLQWKRLRSSNEGQANVTT